MDIYILRHGHTNFNELSLCNDDPRVEVYLTAVGKAQAKNAAESLSAAKFDRIIVSPLPRTRETAEIINQFHGVSIEEHPDIVDIRTGFDSRPVAEYFSAISHDELNARVNGGESLLDHKRRIERFINWLKTQPESNILVVAHEETVRVFVAYFEGNVDDSELRNIHIKNCEFRRYSV